MENILGKKIRICKAKQLDLNLKYQWTQAAMVVRKDYFSRYLCPFTDIPEEPGVYLFSFPQGYYVGQAKNLQERFTSHFYDMYSSNCKDWHSSFQLKTWKAAKYFLKNKCAYYYMIVDKDKLDLYEQSALAQILKNNMTGKYYNTVYYKEEGEE